MSSTAIEIKVIGCGDAFGSGGRMNTCFYVKAAGRGFLVDCGATALPALKKNGISVDDIDAVLISHFHGDHFGGLPFLLLEAAVYGREKKLTIISPPGCEERLRGLLAILYPGTVVLEKLQLEFLTYAAYETLDWEELQVQAFPVLHTEAALPHGLRVSVAGQVISYSGDTEWTDSLLSLAAGADLFICECNFYSSRIKGHLNYQQLIENKDRLKHKRILLTHLDTEMLDNLDKVTLDCAHDGKTILLFLE